MRQYIDKVVGAGEYVAKDTDSKVLLFICGLMVLLIPFGILIGTLKLVESKEILLSAQLEWAMSMIVLLPLWILLMVFGYGVVRQVRAERKK